VDDAIVVVEAVSEIMDSRKLSAREATKAAMKEVSARWGDRPGADLGVP